MTFNPWSAHVDTVDNHYYTANAACGSSCPMLPLYLRDSARQQVRAVYGPWRYPCSVVVDSIGAIYVFDCPQTAGRIWVQYAGRVLPLVGDSDGFTDGQGTQVRFGAYGNNAMVFDDAGHLCVLLTFSYL